MGSGGGTDGPGTQKPANILLDGDLHVRLADFGLSRAVVDSLTMTGAIGTPQYMAPEVILESRYSEKADVYSVAIIAAEVLSGRVPYAGLNPIQIAMRVTQATLRPPLPAETPPALAELLQRAWAQQPADRPSCAGFAAELRGIAADLGVRLDCPAVVVAETKGTVAQSADESLLPTLPVAATLPTVGVEPAHTAASATATVDPVAQSAMSVGRQHLRRTAARQRR
jgi:hypothetical protein